MGLADAMAVAVPVYPFPDPDMLRPAAGVKSSKHCELGEINALYRRLEHLTLLAANAFLNFI